MSDCISHDILETFYDGELNPTAREAVDRHLETCRICAAQLESIRQLSKVFTATPRPRLSQIALYRLHSNLDLLTDRGLLKVARILTGLAASVLVFGSLWLTRARPVTPTIAAPSLVAFLDESTAAPTDPGPSDWVMAELGG